MTFAVKPLSKRKVTAIWEPSDPWPKYTCGTFNSCATHSTCDTCFTFKTVRNPSRAPAALERMICGKGHIQFALPKLSRKGPTVVIIPTIASSPHYSTKEQQTLQYAKEHEVESSLLVSASELTFGGLLSRLVYTV